MSLEFFHLLNSSLLTDISNKLDEGHEAKKQIPPPWVTWFCSAIITSNSPGKFLPFLLGTTAIWNARIDHGPIFAWSSGSTPILFEPICSIILSYTSQPISNFALRYAGHVGHVPVRHVDTPTYLTMKMSIFLLFLEKSSIQSRLSCDDLIKIYFRPVCRR